MSIGVDLVALVVTQLVVLTGFHLDGRRWSKQHDLENARQRRERALERRSLAASLGAEVSALAELIRRYGYLEDLRSAVVQEYWHWWVHVRERPVLPVHEANMHAVGVLGPNVCRELARHYLAVEAFLHENSYLMKLSECGNVTPDVRRQGRGRVRSQLEVLEEVISIQSRLIPALDRIAEGVEEDGPGALVE